MPRKIKAASVQMDANPAPPAERLDRAERLVIQAAQAGAQLVVLPELFNTGYTYSDANFRLAEPMDGATATWLRETAERLGIHLGGSLLLLEQGEIYNSMLLFSPAGQMWRYDKSYPWAWERGYFRERRGMTVAHTELGDLGMMICWDAAHRGLWKQYAGKVDMLVMTSCPPDAGHPTYHFPDGSELTLFDLGSRMAFMQDAGRQVFDDLINQQTAWLNVPALNTGASGYIRTNVPRGSMLVWGFSLVAPRLARLASQADQMQMSCGMIPSCKVVNANGDVLTERTQAEGEGFTLAEVELSESKSMPRGPQPASPLSAGPYLMADVLIPFLMKSIYHKGLRKRLAKVGPSTH
jgi:hypothetical protein